MIAVEDTEPDRSMDHGR